MKIEIPVKRLWNQIGGDLTMSNWKKLAMFSTSALLLAACGNDAEDSEDMSDAGTNGEDEFKIAMITDTGGIDDRSFNQSAWEGMKDWAAENGDTDEDTIRYYQSDAESDYVPHLNTATTDGYDVIYGIGFLLEDPVTTIAQQNPDRWYGLVDAVIDEPNVVSLTFRDQEGGFLAGVTAALTTETDKIGFIGGVESPTIDRFQTGFTEGVKYIDDSLEVDIQYADSFSDTGVGQQIAAAMFANGIDVIYHASGAVGNGAFQEARNRMENGSETDLWVIGVDRDQEAEGKWSDGNVTLSSTVKQVGRAIALSATDAMEGNFAGGENISYGFKEDGIEFTRGYIADDVWETVEEVRQKIIDGEIEVKEFTYSETE